MCPIIVTYWGNIVLNTAAAEEWVRFTLPSLTSHVIKSIYFKSRGF